MVAYVADLLLNFTRPRKCDDTQRQRFGSSYIRTSDAAPSNEPDLSVQPVFGTQVLLVLCRKESWISSVTLENQSRE